MEAMEQYRKELLEKAIENFDNLYQPTAGEVKQSILQTEL